MGIVFLRQGVAKKIITYYWPEFHISIAPLQYKAH